MSVSIDIWGPNIWYLFHTIAHNLKESSFIIVKNIKISYTLQKLNSKYSHFCLQVSF